MFFWLGFPFVRYALFFIIGLLGYSVIPRPSAILITICLIASFLVIVVALNLKWSNNSSLGLVAMLFLITAGYFCAHQNDPRQDPWHILNNHKNHECIYIGTLVENEDEKEKTYKSIIALNRSFCSGSWKSLRGKILIYREKNDSLALFNQGDQLVFKTTLKPLKTAGNPNEFNYARYLSRKGIFFQGYVKEGQFERLVTSARGTWRLLIAKARDHLERLISKNVTSSQEKGIAKALLIGVKNDLDENVKQAYAQSGAMHILAISGLHVGIIYLFISTFLKPIKNVRLRKKLLVLLALPIIWSFALIAGGTPSVLRASIMFSCLIIAEGSNRKTNIYNTLSIAALIILLYDPNQLFEVGFQLSFLAVLGIVYFYKKIYPLVYIQNEWIDKIWQLAVVTVSVQLATFPLSLFYFNELPLHSILTNMVAVPAAFLILFHGLVLFAVGEIGILASAVGTILKSIISVANTFFFWLSGSTVFRLTDVYLSSIQLWMLLCMLVCLVIFMETRKLTSMVFIALFLLVFQLDNILRYTHKPVFIAYNHQNNLILEWVKGSTAYRYSQNEMDPITENYVIHPAHLRYALKQVSIIGENDTNVYQIGPQSFLYVQNGKSFLVWSEKELPKLKNPLNVDFVILNESPDFIGEFFKLVRHKELILSPSLFYQSRNKVIAHLNKMGIPYFDIKNHGAYTLFL